MVDPAPEPGTTAIHWPGAVRIIRSAFPPIDLFEDIADPADWPLLLSGEQKSNPRLMAGVGNLDLVPPARRVGGPGASWLMAPFTHASPDRPSRFSDGHYGVLYAARAFETALFETIHHHARFMAATHEAPGWTSQFRELVLTVKADCTDLLGRGPGDPLLHPDDYTPAQDLARRLRRDGSDGIAYPSVRHEGGQCVGLFYPDGASGPIQARHLDYHWNGTTVDLVRTAGGSGGEDRMFRVVETG
ncbi:RES domain-containing protein [Altererythrobacter xixiisoli]|uniref:RES domain-containing protein n=1 Tax=Croceibacterium xixiisoli TaxID=1476466 RepID=A0A6I4TYL1_9SPHN|nr:RES family NAD+ phosphorylase [Croceibacterium xixiisoli]MXO99453.1 RES domain-containing protein [Croceibacterium xixiisoli]